MRLPLLALTTLALYAAPASAQITQIASGISGANNLTVDAAGNVYVTAANAHAAYKVTPGGSVSQILGPAGDGMGNTCSFPEGIAVDSTGNVYVCSSGNLKLFKITPAGVVTVPLAHPVVGGNVTHVEIDAADNLYVAAGDRLLKVTPGGTITTLIDVTGDGTFALNNARDIAIDGSGNVFLANYNALGNVFKVTPGGVVTTIIGPTGDGAGNPLDRPWGVATDAAGNVFVAGQQTRNVFKITPASVITEIIDMTGDGQGNALGGPIGIAVDGLGNAFVTSGFIGSNAFRVAPDGTITEIIDATGDGMGSSLNLCINVALDAAGNVYATGFSSNNVFKIGALPTCPMPATTDLFGTGNEHGTHGRAWLSTTAQPVFGDWGGLRLDYAGPGAETGVLIFGLDAKVDPFSILTSVPIFVDLAQPHGVVPFSTVAGATEFSFLARLDAELCTGTPFYFQALIADSSMPSEVPGPFPIVASNRVDWTIGHRSPVVITEVMQNPGGGVSDNDGEWFEIYNPTLAPFDLNGCTIRDDDGDTHVITGAPLLMPGAYYVLGEDGNTAVNGGVTVDYDYAGVTLANGDDELEIVHPTLGVLDRVAWDGGPVFPDPNGASMSLDPTLIDAGANDFGGNWCEASSAFGAQFATPGAANDACP